MTLQQMEYMVAIDKYRSFGLAAESCNVTQSTISQLVRKLEQELDVVIFDRHSHPVRPTAIGQELIEQAKQVLQNASRMKELVAMQREEVVGSLNLGISTHIAPYLLPKMLRQVAEQYPHLSLSVEEDRLATMTQKLERAEIDIAILATPLHNGNFFEIPIYNEPFLAYVSPGDPLYEKPTLQVGDLSNDRIWMLRESYCPHSGNFNFCSRSLSNQIVYRAGSTTTLVRIVDENGGYTIIPGLHIPLLSAEQLPHVRPLTNPVPSREVSLVIRRDYVQERMLNVVAGILKQFLPEEMIVERIKRYDIKL